MSYLGTAQGKYESALVRRFLHTTYGSDADTFALVERPDLQRPSRADGWPDLIYHKGQEVSNLVIELGRLVEDEQEIWFEKRVESLGHHLRDQLRGKLPGFYIIELPYDFQVPKGRGKAKASKQLLDNLARAITRAASEGLSSIHNPIPTKLVKIDKPGSDVYVTPMKQDSMGNGNVLRDPIYVTRFNGLLIESTVSSEAWRGMTTFRS